MKLTSILKRLKWSDVLFLVLLVLLILPQTRLPIQVALNQAKMLVWPPSVNNLENSAKVAAFSYYVKNGEGENEAFRIADGQITFLSFWATWCAPCVAELPSIQSLYELYGKDINVILVSNEAPEIVQSFLKKRDLQVPIYVPVSHVPEILQTNRIPTTFLIDADGNIRIKETGATNWNSDKVHDLIDALIGKKEG